MLILGAKFRKRPQIGNQDKFNLTASTQALHTHQNVKITIKSNCHFSPGTSKAGWGIIARLMTPLLTVIKRIFHVSGDKPPTTE